MKKVLRIINRLNLGGPTYNAAFLTKYLEPEFETLLVSGMIDETEESSEYIAHELGLEPVYIPEMYRDINLVQDRKAYRKIKNIIREFKPDIVHTHAAKAGTLGRLAAINCKVPIILHTFHGHVFHSYFSPFKTRMFLEIERYLATRSTRIIAISERQKKELGLIYKVAPLDKIEVIPLGFNLKPFQENQVEKRKQFRKYYLLEDDEIAVSIIGRLVPVKNHKLFIDAMKIIFENTNKKVRAFIVGDGEERINIENYISSLGLDYVNFTKEKRKSLITFTSWKKDIDVVNAGSDIIALCSFNEGTPVSLIEAQAANKPIVTTRVGGITDVVIPEKTALISSKKSVINFARNLFMLIEDDELRNQMGTTGHDFVSQKFSYTRLVKDMAELYNKLLKEKS
ncbi:glycosyl transferase family 1 [Bacteroidota bacterium]|nr:glycosyl transferase family 1 [Bacteroidota bacterium]